MLDVVGGVERTVAVAGVLEVDADGPVGGFEPVEQIGVAAGQNRLGPLYNNVGVTAAVPGGEQLLHGGSEWVVGLLLEQFWPCLGQSDQVVFAAVDAGQLGHQPGQLDGLQLQRRTGKAAKRTQLIRCFEQRRAMKYGHS